MKVSRHLLVIGVVGLDILLTATPVRTQESQIPSLLLTSPDSSQLFSLEGALNNQDLLISPASSVWFQELSPLDLAILPEGAWIDPRANLHWPWLVGSQDEWGPLSEEALDAWEKEFTSKALEYSAELADSLRASYLSQGIEWTKEAFSSYQDRLAKRYRLHFKVSDKQAAFHYNLQY